jgi:hypothetical protein
MQTASSIERRCVPHGRDCPAPCSRAKSRHAGNKSSCDRSDLARTEGRLYGIGFAAVVEPSISNISRGRALPGASSAASRSRAAHST